MSKRDYERLSIEEFGRQLITSGDLDPVYIALANISWSDAQRHRFMIAYWCFYHCGVAAYMSEHEGMEFHREMFHAAINEKAPYEFDRWPRGSERRHARGQQAVEMVQDIRERYGDAPERMVEHLNRFCTGGMSFSAVANQVRVHKLFGPWIAFKVGDMLERVEGRPVNFDQAQVFMFRDPMKAAEMLYRQRMDLPKNVKVKMEVVVPEIVRWLKKVFGDLKAPPGNDRAIDLQECETVLCKWKSHVNGHYPLNNDIDEINEGLIGWGTAADQFAFAMPKSHERC